MLDYILIIIGFLWLIFATITDIKFREVPDWVSYSFVVIGLGTRSIYSILTYDWVFILYGIAGFLLFFLIGNIMYYTKQWGGGDAKLLMGLGAVFGSYPASLLDYFNPNLNIPFILILLINIIIAGGIYGFGLSLFLAIKNWNKFIKEIKKLKKEKINISRRNISFFIVIMAVVISFFISDFRYKFLIYLFSFFIILLNYLFLYLKAIEEVCMYKYVDVNKLTEGDWIVKDVFLRGKKIYKAERLGITKNNIARLKNSGVKKVLVKEGLPFVPAFLIALIISLIFGNLMVFFPR